MGKIINNGIEYGGPSEAEYISYNNSTSNLKSATVQMALDEIQEQKLDVDNPQAFGTLTVETANKENGIEISNGGKKVFEISDRGSIYSGNVCVEKGINDGVLVATGPEFILEHGSVYFLTAVSYLKPNGDWRSMQTYVIGTGSKLGATTTAQGVARVSQLNLNGTVGMNIQALTEPYVDERGITRYKSKIRLGSCTTAIKVRYSIWKMTGSEEDFE